MRVLFDHNVPKKLRSLLPGHYVITSREMGWDTLKNGDLMTAAEDNGFEAMVTGDKKISYQQNLEGRKLALVVLPTTDWGRCGRIRPLLLPRWMRRSLGVSGLLSSTCPLASLLVDLARRFEKHLRDRGTADRCSAYCLVKRADPVAE